MKEQSRGVQHREVSEERKFAADLRRGDADAGTAYRKIAAAVAGVALGAVLPNVIFVASCAGYSGAPIVAALAASVLGGTALLLQLAPIRSIGVLGSRVVAVVAVGIVLSARGWNDEIKAVLARHVGAFDGLNPIEPADRRAPETELFAHPDAGYTVYVPANWRSETLQPFGLPYFRLYDRERVLLEFRPQCNNRPEEPLALLQARQRKQKRLRSIECFTWRGSFDACLTKQSTTTPDRRGAVWTWLGQGRNSSHYIVLDFVLYEESAMIERQVADVIASLQIKNMPEPIPRCVVPSAWAN